MGGRGGGGPTWVITGAGGASIGSADLELASWSRKRRRGAGCDKP